jgi:uncharacterized Zn finger protein
MSRYGYGSGSYWGRYVSVAEQRQKAARLAKKLSREGRQLSPVVVEGRTISRTFWGKAWCSQCESFADYSNRLARGKRYARNGSVLDLQISQGKVEALISGSEIYSAVIEIKEIPKTEWQSLLKDCRGSIHSALDLLQGKLDAGVLEKLTNQQTGLLPRCHQIHMQCSCPDWADLCKHLAAVLYGIGARLDKQPELLFTLRGVDPTELLTASLEEGTEALLGAGMGTRLEDEEDLGALFGIDLGEDPAPTPRKKKPSVKRKKKPSTKPNPARKKVSPKRRPAGKKTPPEPPSNSPTPLPPRIPRLVRPRDLLNWGIPRSTFQNWVGTEILMRTEQRGVYRTTGKTRKHIKAFLAAR